MSQAIPFGNRKRRILWISMILGLPLVVFACLFYQAFHRKQQTLHLIDAVRKKDKVQVRAMLAQGADPNAPMTPPSLGFADMLRVAFHLQKPRAHGTTIFMYAIGHCNNAIVQSLLDAGGDVHDQTSTGATALTIAVGDILWYPDINQNMVLLVEHGADVNHYDKYGATPLSHAADNPRDLAYLLAHGADPNHADRYGVTPLMIASSLGNSANMRALLQAGANINAHTSEGFTALMASAADAGNSEIVLLLLQSGADATLRDKDGKTAEDYAMDNHHPAVAATLQQYRLHHPAK